jgi:hypothetical protein
MIGTMPRIRLVSNRQQAVGGTIRDANAPPPEPNPSTVSASSSWPPGPLRLSVTRSASPAWRATRSRNSESWRFSGVGSVKASMPLSRGRAVSSGGIAVS